MKANTEENKALVQRFFAAIENNSLEEFDAIVATNYDDHLPGQSPGREVLKKYFSGLHVAFKELKLPIHAIIAEGDKVAVYNSIQGVHDGDYGSFKAKGNLVDAKAFQLYRIENGQLAEHWEIADFMTLLGFSMGGAVVIHYVTKYNAAHVSKLALFAAATPSWIQREGFPYGLQKSDVDGLINATLTGRQDLIASFGASFPAREGNISKNVEKWLENINLEAWPYAITQSITALRDLDLTP